MTSAGRMWTDRGAPTPWRRRSPAGRRVRCVFVFCPTRIAQPSKLYALIGVARRCMYWKRNRFESTRSMVGRRGVLHITHKPKIVRELLDPIWEPKPAASPECPWCRRSPDPPPERTSLWSAVGAYEQGRRQGRRSSRRRRKFMGRRNGCGRWGPSLEPIAADYEGAISCGVAGAGHRRIAIPQDSPSCPALVSQLPKASVRLFSSKAEVRASLEAMVKACWPF